ncbi:hypothetical protein ACIP93_24715 [Streptomyces sp. NPDC088745]|uniref:hypothetical protein n=1 Tax=Streptomyces sp. NPDC088745 TaxID=3365884 RepID=UPI0037FF3208
MSNAMVDGGVGTEQLEQTVCLGLREGNLDPQNVVALACELLGSFHDSDAVLEVIERNPAQVSSAEMTALARRILDDVGFDPGSTEAAPSWRACATTRPWH